MLNAVVIIGPEIPEELESEASGGDSSTLPLEVTPLSEGTPLVCVEVLGRSVVGRLIEDLRRAGVDTISVFADVSVAAPLTGIPSSRKITVRPTKDCWAAVQQEVAPYNGRVESTLVVHVSAYVEFDLEDLLQFHREESRGVTRAFDNEGPLDVWIVDHNRIAEFKDLQSALRSSSPARYLVRGYVNRLAHPRDLRRLVADGLTSRCRLRPLGVETRPGVWIDDGAQVNRDSRVVAPAYIGRGAKVEAQCLITRCSNVEGNCHVDYGTVVEDSSILTNTYVGIGLDLSHSIVEGNNLLNLERNVTLEIADPCVIRQNRVARKDKNRRSPIVLGLGTSQFAPAEESSR